MRKTRFQLRHEGDTEVSHRGDEMAVDLYDFVDFREFLDRWFTAMKEEHSYMSHRWFARKMGTSDASVLLNIIRGRKRLTTHLEDFIRVLELDENEAEYFRLLVMFAQTPYIEDRDRIYARLLAVRARMRPSLSEKHLQFMSSPLYAAIYELARIPGFRIDIPWIEGRLQPPPLPGEVAEAVALLQELEMLVEKDGQWVPAEVSLESGAEVVRLGSFPYHRKADEWAERAVGQLLERKRDKVVIGFTAAVPSSRMAELRELWFTKLNEVAKEIDGWSEPDQVIQVNIRVFPVTTEEQ